MEKRWAWWCMPVIPAVVGKPKNRRIVIQITLRKSKTLSPKQPKQKRAEGVT
jgi:hypothetical protein